MVLQDQQSKHHLSKETRFAASAALRMTPRQYLVDRRDHCFIGEHCIDLSRDEPITEATLRVSRFNQAPFCTSDMQYHCRSRAQIAFGSRGVPRRICDFIAARLNLLRFLC